MKILLIEHDPATGKKLQQHLQQCGYECTWVRDGESGFRLFCCEVFPLVIVDWLLTEMDGLEIVRRIRELPRSDYVYIIMLSAIDEKWEMINAINQGVDDFLSKPILLDELSVRVVAGLRVIRSQEVVCSGQEDLQQDNRRLTRGNDRMRQMLMAAARIQRTLLPPEAWHFEGLRIAWELQPSQELSGDMLNVVDLGEDKVGFYLIDVSGQGLAAALLSVSLTRMLSPNLGGETLYHPCWEGGQPVLRSPAQVALVLNRQFQSTFANPQFFSLFYGLLDRSTGEVSYIVAGYPACVLVRSDGSAEYIKKGALPVGLLPDISYSDEALHLRPGERLYVFSDSVVRSFSQDSREIYPDSLLKAMETMHTAPMDIALDYLMRLTAENNDSNPNLNDDVSILALELD